MAKKEVKPVKKFWVLRNLLFYLLFLGLVYAFCTVGLKFITRHDKYVETPDFSGMSFPEAKRAASSAGIKVAVEDSVYVDRIARGSVYTQYPLPGATVKKGRVIDLTINATCVKKIKMPSLVGISMRQAKAEILSKGLVVGKYIYQADIATNNVLRQLYKGKDVAADKPIPLGSQIDLVLGLNYEDAEAYVPNLDGMTAKRAIDAIKDNSLNVEKVVYDKSVETYEDSLSAVVYKQDPLPSRDPVEMGSAVKIVLRKK